MNKHLIAECDHSDPQPSPTPSPRWTLADLSSLPPTLPVATADEILGIGRTLGKRLRKEGKYPLRLLPSLGRHHKVRTAELVALLGVDLLGSTGYTPASDGTLLQPSTRTDLREVS